MSTYTQSSSSDTAGSVAMVNEKQASSGDLSQTLCPTVAAPVDRKARPLTKRLDHACANLTPSFFSLNMGTGITSILLYNFPYPSHWLRILGIIIFVLNLVIFAMLAFGNLVRYIRFKGVFTSTLTHPVAGLFWGTLPMGLATIINMIAYVCVPAWGESWARVALGLWWIDALLSIFVNLGMVFAMFSYQTHTADTVAATWLLPIVSSVVAAASGGVVASAIMPFSSSLAASTVIVSYVIWGTGVPLACFIMALWIYRTAIGGVPAPAALPSVFLPLGPCGQGSFGIILLGRTVRHLAHLHGTSLTISNSNDTAASMMNIADAIYAGGLITGLVLWGLGLCWYLLAFAIISNHLFKKSNRNFFHHSKFSVGLWALTFPIGVFATSTTILASELDSPAFRVTGAFLSAQVALHWVYVTILTLYKVGNGTIFVAPEVVKYDGQIPKRFGKQARDTEMQ